MEKEEKEEKKEEFSKHSLSCAKHKGQSQLPTDSTNLQQILVAAHFRCDSCQAEKLTQPKQCPSLPCYNPPISSMKS